MIKNKKFLLDSLKERKTELIEYASNDLKNDEEIALMVLVQNGYYLRYFSKEIRGKRDLVKIATESSKYALEFADKELRIEKDFLYELSQYIMENKSLYKEEFETLQRYWREDDLLEKMKKNEKSDKISESKKKI